MYIFIYYIYLLYTCPTCVHGRHVRSTLRTGPGPSSPGSRPTGSGPGPAAGSHPARVPGLTRGPRIWLGPGIRLGARIRLGPGIGMTMVGPSITLDRCSCSKIQRKRKRDKSLTTKAELVIYHSEFVFTKQLEMIPGSIHTFW